MQHKMGTIRWLLVIPSAFAGWYLALFIGLLLYSVADSFCPPELMVSGSCQATWHKPPVDDLVIFGASLSATLSNLFPVLVAPAKRSLVAKVIFIGGVAFAVSAVVSTSAWGAFSGAILFGALTLFITMRFEGKTNAA